MKIYYFLLGVSGILMAMLAPRDIMERYLVSNYGEIVVGHVIDLPNFCLKRNFISAKYKNDTCSILISSLACQQGRWKIGDTISVVYVPEYGLYAKKNETILNTLFDIIFFIVFLSGGIFLIIGCFKNWVT